MNRQFRWINDYLAETARLLDQLDRAAIDQAAELLLACYQRRGRVWTLGNGGSASTAATFRLRSGQVRHSAESAPFRYALSDRQHVALHGLGKRR